MNGERATMRSVLSITGADRIKFLQGLITNDTDKLKDGLVYAALLTPQGKYLVDFFLFEKGDAVLIDVDSNLAASLIQRLSIYKLRAEVEIAKTTISVSRGLGQPNSGAFQDPRSPALGWRAYDSNPASSTDIDWEGIRVEHCIPETGIELIPNETFILEAGFESLEGVDFKKGCYVGQEVTARMKHKTELRKGIAKVALSGSVPVGTAITVDGKNIGSVFTQSDCQGLAYLRFDRVADEMSAGDVKIKLLKAETS